MGRPATCACEVCEKCRHREYMRNWYQRTGRNYRNNATRREYDRVRYWTDDEYRAKKKARNMVSIRLSRGTMTRGVCAMCGSREDARAHHNDYTRPLDVTWLCSRHHDIIHGPLPRV
jgi:hypothetical protein